MRADGSEQVRLTRNGQSNVLPTWSPNGEQIAFVSHKVVEADEIPPAHLYVMNWDGAELVDLTPSLDSSITSPVWSPDGRRIAFVAIAPGSTDDAFYGANIFVVDRDGANLAQITQMSPGTVGCQSPAWSPDSAQIAFVCRSMMLVGVQIANVDGTGLWGFDSLGQVSRIFWLPSGETVAFADGQCIMGAFSARYLLERGAIDFGAWPCLDGTLDALGLDFYGPMEVIWSPIDDSRFIVQMENKIQIVDIPQYVLVALESGSRRLQGSSSWSLDGERIAYAIDDGSGAEIYTLKLDENEITRLTYNQADDFMPAWQP